MAIIELKDISKTYGYGEAATVALDKINLTVKKGEFVAIMGPSGSGKSTLMHIIGLLDHPTEGSYELEDKAVEYLSERVAAKVRRQKIGFIFQSFNLLPRMTVIDNVALPLTYAGVKQGKRLQAAEKLLKQVGLGDRQYYLPNQISGGQAQRVAVARALVNKPALVIADEPTGNLDSASSLNVMELLRDIHKKGNTILMVTHNPDLAKYADRVVTMRDGKIESDSADKPKRTRKAPAKKKTTKKTAKKSARNTKAKS